MLALANEAQARKADLGDLLAREEGKTLPEAIGEVTRAGNIFKFFAGEALRIPGEVVPSVCPGIGVEFTREPVGVVRSSHPGIFPSLFQRGRSRRRFTAATRPSSSCPTYKGNAFHVRISLGSQAPL